MLLADVAKTHDSLFTCDVQKSVKQARKPRKTFTSFSEIDFFPGEAQKQTGATLQDLELARPECWHQTSRIRFKVKLRAYKWPTIKDASGQHAVAPGLTGWPALG